MNLDLLKQYDWFWFPDDDILTTWDNVNDFFRICRDFDLQLAQPAIGRESNVFHEVTREKVDYMLRFTMFVEGMMPAFCSQALRTCLPVMAEESRFGWGHDCVWPMLLGYPDNKIAVVDRCAMLHTRPPGINTDRQAAKDEAKAVTMKYGTKLVDQRVRGGIFREIPPGSLDFCY